MSGCFAPQSLRLVSVGLAMHCAASDEYHQTFVPGRKGRLFDVGVDTAGVWGAMLLDRWLARRRQLCSIEGRPTESRLTPAR
jgi:VanZ family protein